MTDTTEADEARRDVRGVALEPSSEFIGPCPTWCQDGHSRYGQSIDIALELVAEQYDAGSSTHDVTTVRPYPRQHYRETEARVVLARDERPGFTLTLAHGYSSPRSRRCSSKPARSVNPRRPRADPPVVRGVVARPGQDSP